MTSDPALYRGNWAPHTYGPDEQAQICCPFHPRHPIHHVASVADIVLPPNDEPHPFEPDVRAGGDPWMCSRPTDAQPLEICGRGQRDRVHSTPLGDAHLQYMDRIDPGDPDEQRTFADGLTDDDVRTVMAPPLLRVLSALTPPATPEQVIRIAREYLDHLEQQVADPARAAHPELCNHRWGPDRAATPHLCDEPIGHSPEVPHRCRCGAQQVP